MALAAGLAFHWSFFWILVRHLRFFTETVPVPIQFVESLDSFLQIGTPLLYMTDVILLAAVAYLFVRRIAFRKYAISRLSRITSALSDHGHWNHRCAHAVHLQDRYREREDVNHEPGQLQSGDPQGDRVLFYIHLFLLCILFAYFPFSKLVHMAGVFMSPPAIWRTRAARRDTSILELSVHVHTYDEYENDFRDKMKGAGLPVEKE